MNPLRLRLVNFGVFRDLDLDLADGVTALAGPNGSGKSTILRAVELALFADGRTDSFADLTGPHGDRWELELEFEHGGFLYLVRRAYRKNATLDLILEGEPITRETIAETQRELERILGLSRQTFNASAYLGQGNAAMFADAKPAERKALLGEILDPRGLWPDLCQRARDDRHRTDNELIVVNDRMRHLEEKLEQRPDAELRVTSADLDARAAKQRLVDAEALVEQQTERLAANQAAAQRVLALRERRHQAAREHARVEKEYEQAEAAAAALEAAREELDRVGEASRNLPRLEALVAEEQRVRNEAALAASRRAALEEKARMHAAAAAHARQEAEAFTAQHAALTLRRDTLAANEDGSERCDRCEQILGAEAKAAALASLTTEIADREGEIGARKLRATSEERWADEETRAAEAIDVPNVPAADHQEELARARASSTRVAALAERITGLEEKAGRLDELAGDLLVAKDAFEQAAAELVAAALEVGDEGTLLKQLDDAKVDRAERRRRLTEQTDNLARARARVEQLDEAAAELARLVVERDRLHAQLDTLRLGERCFGRDGVPLLLIETVIPQIEAEANRILELMPTSRGDTFRLELHTLREKKDGQLADTLDVVVHDTGGARPYETFSGGERGRLNVALRLALAHTLATRRGAEVRLLALDEVEYLDGLGQQQLVDVVRTVEPVFGKVLLVSHHPAVRDAFENVVDVTALADVRVPA